jgi:RND family efflux transporter MFP subunit
MTMGKRFYAAMVAGVALGFGGETLMAVDEVRVESAGLALIDEATISAPQSGRLADVPVREGTRIASGDQLARLDCEEQEVELRRLKTEALAAKQLAADDTAVRIAQKELELAELEWQRAVDLNRNFPNTVSVAQLERLKLTRDREQLEVEQADRELKMAELKAEVAQRLVEVAEVKLRERTLTAPLDGMVVEVHRQPGEWVQAGEPLVRVLRVDRLQAEGYVPAKDLAVSLEGQKATMLVPLPAGGDTRYEGTVTFVSPEANPVNGVVKVLVEIKNHDGRLRAGYLGTLLIHVDSPPADSQVLAQ